MQNSFDVDGSASPDPLDAAPADPTPLLDFERLDVHRVAALVGRAPRCLSRYPSPGYPRYPVTAREMTNGEKQRYVGWKKA
jgi:hypothetical protein